MKSPRVTVEQQAIWSEADSNGLRQTADTATGNGDLQVAIERMLSQLRETLHRRGRFSSRNEAIDELAKLLFAHVMSTISTGVGISRSSVTDNNRAEGSASGLKEFVRDVFERFMPSQLAHELELSDFDLRIKPSEDTLADELIDAFSTLNDVQLVDRSLSHRTTPLHGLDVLNSAFGSFLSGAFDDEKQLSQYLTPPEVVDVMVELALDGLTDEELAQLASVDTMQEFGLILDPSCGVGSFLADVFQTLRDTFGKEVGHERTADWTRRMATELIMGFDKSERMMRLALCNLVMFGFPSVQLHLINAISRSGADSEIGKSIEGGVGLILTNPPFGAEFSGRDLEDYRVAHGWSERPLRKVDSEVLFMERYFDWLRPGGHLVTVVPDSILTNRGVFQDLRRGLADMIDLRSVVSLPPVTFGAAGTTTKTSIIHCVKKPNDVVRNRSTYFAICRSVGYDVATRGANKIKVTKGSSDLPAILSDVKATSEGPSFGRVVSDVELHDRWDATFHASLPVEMQERLEQATADDLWLSDLADLVNERTNPAKFVSETFDYIEISNVSPNSFTVKAKEVPITEAPSRARKLVRSGDVLVSTVRPERRTIGIVRDSNDGAVCTTGFAVLRPKAVDSYTLAKLLGSDFVTAQLLRYNIGIAYPAIEETCLSDVLLPIRKSMLSTLQPGGKDIIRLEAELEEQRDQFARTLDDAVASWLSDEPTRS